MREKYRETCKSTKIYRQTFLTEAYVACELTITNFRANFWKVANRNAANVSMV